MSAFVSFLDRLLTDGTAVLSGPPVVAAVDRTAAVERLAAAHAVVRLEVPGPALPFDERAAVAAAEFLWRATWLLVHRGESVEELERSLVVPTPPRTAAEHLSADLVLRYLAVVHRRARSIDPTDMLTRRTEARLRQAPLSGVLSDVEEGPSGVVELGGHDGLLLLYAERLADHVRPAWVVEGAAWPFIELVFTERGLPLPAPASKLQVSP
jgi:hypothetical protein